MLSFASLRDNLVSQNPNSQIPEQLSWGFTGFYFSTSDSIAKEGTFSINGAPELLFQPNQLLGSNSNPNIGFYTDNGLGIYDFYAESQGGEVYNVRIFAHSVFRFGNQSIWTMVVNGSVAPWIWTKIE